MPLFFGSARTGLSACRLGVPGRVGRPFFLYEAGKGVIFERSPEALVDAYFDFYASARPVCPPDVFGHDTLECGTKARNIYSPLFAELAAFHTRSNSAQNPPPKN